MIGKTDIATLAEVFYGVFKLIDCYGVIIFLGLRSSFYPGHD